MRKLGEPGGKEHKRQSQFFSSESKRKLSHAFMIALVGKQHLAQCPLKSNWLDQLNSDGATIKSPRNSVQSTVRISKNIAVNQQQVHLTIIDLSADRGFENINLDTFFQIDGVMIVCDIADQDSLQEIVNWKTRQLDHKKQSFDFSRQKQKFMLLGAAENSAERIIASKQIESLAKQWGILFGESFVNDRSTIETAMRNLVGDILNSQDLQPGEQKAAPETDAQDNPNKRCCTLS